jgi:putative FmdB family regulatory protein
MPIRDYHCNDCKHIWEELRKDQSDPSKCPECQRVNINRNVSAPNGFQFKGSGFYQTDFKDK